MSDLRFEVPRHHVWFNDKDEPYTKLIFKKVHSNALSKIEPVLSSHFCVIKCSLMHHDLINKLMTSPAFKEEDLVIVPCIEIEGGVYILKLEKLYGEMGSLYIKDVFVTPENSQRNLKEKYEGFVAQHTDRSLYTKSDMQAAFNAGHNASAHMKLSPQFEEWLKTFVGAKQQNGENTL